MLDREQLGTHEGLENVRERARTIHGQKPGNTQKLYAFHAREGGAATEDNENSDDYTTSIMTSATVVTLLLIASLCNALSQICLKIAMSELSVSGHTWSVKFVARILLPKIWLGLFLFAVSLSIYMYLVSSNDVSLIFPAMGATYVFVVVIASSVLRERLDSWKIAGTGIITIGIALLAAGGG